MEKQIHENSSPKINTPQKSIMDREIPLGKKIGFAIGFMGTQLYNGTQSASTAWFWLNLMAIPNDAYSFIMLVVYNIWNAVNDQIFAHLSDRTRTRWGRRIPWLRAASPIWWLFFVLLYFPFVEGQLALVLYFMIVICIYDMLYTIVANNYNTLMPEMTTKTKERTTINTLANVFGLIGNVAAYLFPMLLKENVVHFQIYVVICGAVATIVLWIPSFIIKERPIPKEEEIPMGFFESIKECLKNKPFLAFAGNYFMKEAALGLAMANIFFFSTHVLQVGGLESALLLGILLLMTAPGFAAWKKFSEKKGTRKAMILSTTCFAATFFFITFSPNIIVSFIILAAAGFSLAGPTQFAYVMLAETTDYDELKTNKRREGIYYGTNALLTKPGLGVGQAILSGVLGATLFVKDKIGSGGEVISQPQPDSAIWGIRFLMGVIPATFMFASAFFAYLYPLTKEKTAEMKAKLAQLHIKKFGGLPPNNSTK